MDDDALVATRDALHALAEHVISPLRVQATGNEIALEARPGGFATPPLPGGGWAGIVGTEVVRAAPDGELSHAPITTLRAAGEHVGLTSAGGLPAEPLAVDPVAAAVVARTHDTGDEALRLLRAQLGARDDGSPIQLWPEHFDIAIEAGPEGARATFGVSPGDEEHPRPYAYVAPWQALPDGPGWDAVGFTGAEIPVQDAGAEDILRFWLGCRGALLGVL